jgi:hypothetical protein
MATISMDYSAAQTVTITLGDGSAGLANGAYRQSSVVDNTTNKFVDALLGGFIRTGSVAPTVNSTIDVFVYGTYDGTNYTSGCSGSDAAYTADGEEDELRFLTAITVDTSTDTPYVFGPVSVAQAFGGVLPSKWGVVVRNGTGQALDVTAADHEIKFIGVKYVSA